MQMGPYAVTKYIAEEFILAFAVTCVLSSLHRTQDGKVLFYFQSFIHKNDLFIECFHSGTQR